MPQTSKPAEQRAKVDCIALRRGNGHSPLKIQYTLEGLCPFLYFQKYTEKKKFKVQEKRFI